MVSGEIVIRRAWRSQLKQVLAYLTLCLAAVLLSMHFDWSIIEGELISWGDTRLVLKLPLFSLVPLMSLMMLIVPIYDATLTVDSRGIEMRRGILGLRQHIMRVRFEDIRGVEVDQTLLERILNVGTLGIGTAAQSDVEIYIDGIPAPLELKEMIQSEKDQRLRVRSTSPTRSTPLQAASGAD